MAHFKVNGSKRKWQGKARKTHSKEIFHVKKFSFYLKLLACAAIFSFSGVAISRAFPSPIFLFFLALRGWFAGENKQKSKLQIRRNYKVS